MAGESRPLFSSIRILKRTSPFTSTPLIQLHLINKNDEPNINLFKKLITRLNLAIYRGITK